MWYQVETNQISPYFPTTNPSQLSAYQWANAAEIYNYCISHGVSARAASGILANMLPESLLNPGQIERGQSIESGKYGGYGLVQWTDAPLIKLYNRTAFFNWCTAMGYSRADGNAQMEYLLGASKYTPGQWEVSARTEYLTFEQFLVSDKDPGTLGIIFHYGYERGVYAPVYFNNGRFFYEYFQQNTPNPDPNPPAPDPDVPTPPSPQPEPEIPIVKKAKKMPIYFYLKRY